MTGAAPAHTGVEAEPWRRCPRCRGSGLLGPIPFAGGPKRCPECDGFGMIPTRTNNDTNNEKTL